MQGLARSLPAGWLEAAASLVVSGSLVVFGALGSFGCRPSREPAPASNLAKTDAPSEIVYELKGGFAGFDLTLTVRPESAAGGAATAQADVVDKGQSVRGGALAPAEWAGLEQLLAAADLERMRPSYGREGAVSDAMEEVVTVRRPGNEVRVTVISDPGDEAPAEFRALTERLRELALTLPSR
jgi:hypothetical protein